MLSTTDTRRTAYEVTEETMNPQDILDGLQRADRNSESAICGDGRMFWLQEAVEYLLREAMKHENHATQTDP